MTATASVANKQRKGVFIFKQCSPPEHFGGAGQSYATAIPRRPKPMRGCNPRSGNQKSPRQLQQLRYFCSMAHDHHDHLEPEQNEIGGPVVFALFLFAIVVVAIGMMAS